ncbi:hypothetical protein QBC43DRAFT_284765 [Cladorrhinum sp. PSN259]|nr:hypothetical protein QBC43DRAFT_284765 [Cladorrhinum sp. PSN259]
MAQHPLVFTGKHEDYTGHHQVYSHAVVHVQDTGAYQRCEAYTESAKKQLRRFPRPTGCPTGYMTWECSSMLSTSLCELCKSAGCVLDRQARSAYGRRSYEQRKAERNKKAEQLEQTNATATMHAFVHPSRRERKPNEEENDSVAELADDSSISDEEEMEKDADTTPAEKD